MLYYAIFKGMKIMKYKVEPQHELYIVSYDVGLESVETSIYAFVFIHIPFVSG